MSPVKSAGATPTTVNVAPFRAIVRPIASADAPNRRVQNACESTATGGTSGRSSPGPNSRPRAAVTPSIVKYPPLTISPNECSVSPSTRSPNDLS